MTLSALTDVSSSLHDNLTLSTIVALGAVILGFIAYVDKNDNRLKYVLAIQALLLGTHYSIEGSTSAAIITFMIAPLNFLSSFPKAREFYPAYTVVILFSGSLAYEGVRDLFPLSAVAISLFALYNMKGVRMRSALILCSMLWIVHDVAYNLQIILFMDITIMILNVIGISRIIKATERDTARTTSLETRGMPLHQK